MSDFEECAHDDTGSLWWFGDICVPSKNEYAKKIQKLGPLGPGDKTTKLRIYITNLQIIEIDSHAISLSMEFQVVWPEHRVMLNVLNIQKAALRPEDQWRIWSPKITIINNKVLEKREQEEFNFRKIKVRKYGIKSFYLYTKVACAMDFGNYPFDRHLCNLEASFNLIHS